MLYSHLNLLWTTKMDVQEELPIGMIAASDPPDNITSCMHNRRKPYKE
jgi:hypothetical protein